MPIEYVLKCVGLGFNPETKSYFLVYFNRATICVLMLWLECSFRNDFTQLWQKPLLSIFQAVNLLLNQPALQPHFTLISPHYSKRNFKSVFRATFPHSPFYSVHSIFAVLRNLVWKIWFKKSGSRKVVDQKKRCFFTINPSFFKLEKSGWPEKKSKFAEPLF